MVALIHCIKTRRAENMKKKSIFITVILVIFICITLICKYIIDKKSQDEIYKLEQIVETKKTEVENLESENQKIGVVIDNVSEVITDLSIFVEFFDPNYDLLFDYYNEEVLIQINMINNYYVSKNNDLKLITNQGKDMQIRISDYFSNIKEFYQSVQNFLNFPTDSNYNQTIEYFNMIKQDNPVDDIKSVINNNENKISSLSKEIAELETDVIKQKRKLWFK